MIVLERSEDGSQRRTTVAVWEGPTEGEGRPGRWRLDRITDFEREDRDGSPLFELVDERDPSWLHGGGGLGYAPIWLERYPRSDSKRIVWNLTEEWPEICRIRKELGARPVELQEKTVGLLLALSGGRVEPGVLFNNYGHHETWLFIPNLVDAETMDGAERLDRWREKHSDLELGPGPDAETMDLYLGRKVEISSWTGPAKYAIPLSKTRPEKTTVAYSRFHPNWSMNLFNRELGSTTLHGLLLEATKRGLLVEEEKLGKWLEKHSEIPKLLLDDDEVEIYRLLGEELPVLWLDDRFMEWAKTRV